MSEVKPHIQEMAKTLKKGMKVGDGGAITSEPDLYEKTLPEDLPMDTVKRVYGHTEDVVAAMTLATGQLGEEALKKNKKLDSVSSEMKIGKHGDISVGYLRSETRTTRNPSDQSQPPKDVTKYGVTIPRVRTYAQKNRGELKKVRTMLSEKAEKLFG
jgi:hypothetical protein